MDRGIAPLFLDLGARRGVWSAPRPGRFTPGKDPVPNVQEAGWAPGPVWTCAKNLAPTGIRSPDRPVRRQTLYRLRYQAEGARAQGGILKKSRLKNVMLKKKGCPRENSLRDIYTENSVTECSLQHY